MDPATIDHPITVRAPAIPYTTLLKQALASFCAMLATLSAVVAYSLWEVYQAAHEVS